MSYILEALKKAQAERQLGGVPTIHAESLHASAEIETVPLWRKPVWLALGAALLLVLVLLVLVLTQTLPGPARPAAPYAGPVRQDPGAGLAAPPNGAPAGVPADADAAAPPLAPPAIPAPASMPAPAPASQMPLAAPRQSVPPPKPRLAEQATQGSAAGGQTAAKAQQQAGGGADLASATPARGVAPAPSASAAEDNTIPFLRDLPAALQQQLPAVALGGYIYSKNAPDRLLLVDKVLRHEGEEVAPGLVLERLQPKSAVFNFRGSRYRIAY